MSPVDTSVSGLLSTLTESLTSATTILPSDHNALLPPSEGISLLDTKNELISSYIQNLVFLVILKLRHGSDGQNGPKMCTKLHADAVKKLVELRAFIERGLRPLEGRLRYQIEKVLRAADDAERVPGIEASGTKKSSKAASMGIVNASDSESTSEFGGSHSDSDAKGTPQAPKQDDLFYRPNPAALLRRANISTDHRSSTTKSHEGSAYKPPRITPTAMPIPSTSAREAITSRRQRKSHLLEEYVSSELSSAPQAEPSIGSNSTILNRGRGSLSAREREKQRERIEYEERNLARLPGESRAEKRSARLRGEGPGRRNQYGGEDWTGLGEAGDRVMRSVGKGKVDTNGLLARREKRNRNEAGDVGVAIGDRFEKRRRILEGRAEKKLRRER